jgi:chemotaxis signal transduction protein
MTRLLVLQLEDHRVGLLVERIEGVLPLDAAEREALPPLLRDAAREAVAALEARDRALLLRLDGARLLPEPVLAALVPKAAAS